METQITFTIGQFLAAVGTVCGAITGIAAAVAVLIKVAREAREPTTVQDKRIADLEARVDKSDRLLDNDNKRLATLEKESSITQRALLALLKHGINGNDTDRMQKSMEEIESYLIDR